jgi:hypothetical protein
MHPLLVAEGAFGIVVKRIVDHSHSVGV